jgi:carboxyl-terminal processing protease
MLQSDLYEVDLKRNVYRGILYGSLSIILVGAGFLAGFHVAWRVVRLTDPLSLVEEAHSLIQAEYFGELPDDLSLQRGMIHGMVARIGDPYTSYIEPVAHELQTDDLAGQYGGIGAYISRDEAGYVHLIPFVEGPAAEAGILENDRLIAIDGVEIETDMNLDTIVSLIRGSIGSEIRLTFASRDLTDQAFELKLTRVAIDLPSVTGYTLPDHEEIGVLVITRFSEKTPEEVETTFGQLMLKEGGGLILDLRGNSGGLLDSAIEVSRFFLKDGLILIERSKDGEQKSFECKKPGIGADIPLVVLVDGGTASAAEVVAAALKDNGRAPLIGTNTYGKGSVQSVVALSDGSSLHITAARWLTPQGISLDGVGLSPDIEVASMDPSRDSALDKAVEVLAKELRLGS